MRNNIIKIIAGLFIVTSLTGCSQIDAYHFLRMGNKTGYWGNDAINLFGQDEDDEDYWWDDDEDDDDYYNSRSSSNNNNANSGKSSNNNGSNDYKEGGFSYVYTVGSGECGVYAINSALKGISDIEVPRTYTDKQSNVYLVKYDCNNGFNALEDVKSITFQDGFEKVKVGFGSCMKLETIVLPSTLTKIDCCMLVNCLSFKAIEFKGTISQWNAVEKLDEWNYLAPSFTVKCSDGNIPVEALADD